MWQILLVELNFLLSLSIIIEMFCLIHHDKQGIHNSQTRDNCIKLLKK